MDSQSQWLATLRKLRVNRLQGLAPHKPLLLLVVLEMIENCDLLDPLLKLTPELAFRFSQFGTVVAIFHEDNVPMPWLHFIELNANRSKECPPAQPK